jgi:hypothetical protein
MGAPKLLGGGLLRIKSDAVSAYSVGTSSSRHSSRGLLVLASIADKLQNAGYETTKPKRGRPDDVRLRCVFEDHYIELVLITEEETEDVVTFSLEAWSFWTKSDSPAIVKKASQEWGTLSELIASVPTDCFDSGPMSPLTSDEIDARYAAKEKESAGSK